MGKIYKGSKNNNFINERRFFERHKTILKNWEKFKKLSPRLKKALTYRYDLKENSGNFMSLSEIAKKFKVHKRTVYNWEQKALEIISEKEHD